MSEKRTCRSKRNIVTACADANSHWLHFKFVHVWIAGLGSAPTARISRFNRIHCAIGVVTRQIVALDFGAQLKDCIVVRKFLKHPKMTLVTALQQSMHGYPWLQKISSEENGARRPQQRLKVVKAKALEIPVGTCWAHVVTVSMIIDLDAVQKASDALMVQSRLHPTSSPRLMSRRSK
jgi:hypothetical protein